MKTKAGSPRRTTPLALIAAALLASTLPVAAIASDATSPPPTRFSPQTETGVVGGSIVPPPGGQPALDLLLENTLTDVVVVVPLEPGQATYSATVPAGCYHAYAWLPSFDLMGGHTECEEGQSCDGHALQDVWVEGGENVDGVDITDWHVPEKPVHALSGRMIDGSGADPVEDGVVVIWDRHIMAAGPASQISVPPWARHDDLPGTTILPGFINAHVHNSYRSNMLRAWAAGGVTTVRDLGAPVGLSWDSLRTSLAADPGNARILAAGPLVTCPGGYPIAGNNFPSLTVGSEEEARREIDELIDRGADVIKIVIESGIGELLPVEHAAVIVDTAHSRGIPVTVHLTLERDLLSALEAGVDDIAHMVLDYVPDGVIQQMVESEVAWVPTLAALAGHGTQMHDNLRRFVAAGGTVALGNDGGYLPGLTVGMPLAEIQWMEFAGMTPMQIVVAATSDAAAVCRRQDLLGTLATGKLADILVVEGDPLMDLRALQQPRLVIHEGTVIRREQPTPRRPRGRLHPP